MLRFRFELYILALGICTISTKTGHSEDYSGYNAANRSGNQINFHKVHAADIVLSDDATVANRTTGYCRGITFSMRPVQVNEHIFVKILDTTPTWAGWLQIGFTANDPATLQSSMDKCQHPYSIHRTWSKNVEEKYSKKDSVFFYYVDDSGIVHYGQPDEDIILFDGIDTASDLWSVIYLYGQTLSVQLLGSSGDIRSTPGVETSRENGISYLLSKRNNESGWNEDSHRAMVALYLSGAMAFNETLQEMALMVKELELETALALLRNQSVPLSANQLALYINALLVTCHNPRDFHGFDLIAILKKQMQQTANGINPIIHIVLCNANETLPQNAVRYLNSILESSRKYNFWTDFQAMAVMALVCNDKRNGKSSYKDERITKAVSNFKKLQHADGSFGSIYTSALVVQALLASGHSINLDWNNRAAVNYFLSKQNASDDHSFGDFLSTYLILPVLNEKSLIDVGHVNCPNFRKQNQNDDSVINFKDHLGPKVNIEYSLYVGDHMETVHSISLRVPPNITAIDVMNFAARENPKFKFQYHMSSDNVYINSVGNLSNDPEVGMFWLLYLSRKGSNQTIFQTESPSKMIISGGEHIIMWYKTADIQI